MGGKKHNSSLPSPGRAAKRKHRSSYTEPTNLRRLLGHATRRGKRFEPLIITAPFTACEYIQVLDLDADDGGTSSPHFRRSMGATAMAPSHWRRVAVAPSLQRRMALHRPFRARASRHPKPNARIGRVRCESALFVGCRAPVPTAMPRPASPTTGWKHAGPRLNHALNMIPTSNPF